MRILYEQDRGPVASATRSVQLGNRSAANRRDGPFARAVLGLLTLLSSLYQRWTVMDQLAGMSDRDLADIGLTRFDVQHMTNGSLSQDRAELVRRSSDRRDRWPIWA